MRSVVLFIICLLYSFLSWGQADSNIWLPPPPPHYSFIRYDDNVITKRSRMDSFFSKLVALRHTHAGTVNIIHIGDSHLQADGITRIVRNGMQDFFGDAGRGLVFPYQLANSNAPDDVASSSNTSWRSNRLTSPDKPVKTGISGYGIESPDKHASVRMRLKETDGKQERFNRMVFFMCNDSVCYKMTDSGLIAPLVFNTSQGSIAHPRVVNTDSLITGFELSKVNPGEVADYSFYGVSLEKRDAGGVLYHTIGVNGARYDQFLQNDLFWTQLQALQGDLFIVSLGTNEAQNQFVNEAALINICDSFVHRIHRIAPHAMLLITTPAGSWFKAKKPNKSIHAVSEAFRKFCETRDLPSWDLFHITGGLPSIPAWKKYGLISHDLVHYNNQLQGQLLLNAMAKEYNIYEKVHPYKPAQKQAIVKAKPAPVVKVIKEEVVKATILPPSGKAEEKKPQAPKTPEKEIVPYPSTKKPGSHIMVEYHD